ncbi:MAG: DUF4238 domain-containing protein [Verrucomicrobiia bacterium]|jgi:hypothetical protein
MEKKNQHIVPHCYLKAWCDPNAPCEHEPYVWVHPKAGGTPKNKSPRNLFVATEFYTVQRNDGIRDLTIENAFSDIENQFCKTVRPKLEKQDTLDLDERRDLCLFAAALFLRTRSQKTNWEDGWSKVDLMVRLFEKQHGLQPGLSLQTAQAAEHGHKMFIVAGLEEAANYIYRMEHAFFIPDDNSFFITSDQPCVLFNPKMKDWPPLYRSVGFGQKHVEVTLPITPKLLFCATWQKMSGYTKCPAENIDLLNQTTRWHCARYFVSPSRESKPIWFENGKRGS